MFIIIYHQGVYSHFDSGCDPLPFKLGVCQINKIDDDYYLEADRGYYFKDQSKRQRLEYRFYLLKSKYLGDEYRIYVYENSEGFTKYNFYEKTNFLFCFDNKANIVCHDKYLRNTYLYYHDGVIETNSDFLLLNGQPCLKSEVKDGDEIEYLGFSVHFIYDCLYINSFCCDVRLKKTLLKTELVEYPAFKAEVENYYYQDIRELKFEKPKNYEKIRQRDVRNLFYQLGPSLTMSFAMLGIGLLNIYNGLNNNQKFNTLLPMILMPLVMLLSGSLWPFLADKSEKRIGNKKKKDNLTAYLQYLKRYEGQLNSNYSDYYQSTRAFFDEEKLFYISPYKKDFLKLGLGYYSAGNKLSFDMYEEDLIDEYLGRIRYSFKDRKEFLFIDLKNYTRLTFIGDDKQLLLENLVYELARHHHFADLKIAVYAKDNVYDKFYALPHFFYQGKRLYLESLKDLQELNSSSYSFPLILLMRDCHDYVFSNPAIRAIYLSEDEHDIYKDSQIIVNEKKGYVLENEEVKYCPFDREERDFERLNQFYVDEENNKSLSFGLISDYDISRNYTSEQRGLLAEFAFVGNEVLSFDLHESRDGPHGLIAGSTGSGKSELLISLLLSLAMRYRPDYLNMIIIDFKGGGIVESLSYENKHIPHIVASISNLDEGIFERLIIMIGKECQRRQNLFKDLSRKSSISIMNIDDYRKEDPVKYGFEQLSHLVIVVDEFAELKKEHPQIISELISFSRIGRSLGIHLILATQRPSGVIDEEIWSNARFKIALKVLSEKDSLDVIKVKDAAYLEKAGEFYLRVDESLRRAKSIYSKLDINNNDNYELDLLNKYLDVESSKLVRTGTMIREASYLVNKINEESQGIEAVKWDFEKRPSLNYEDLINIYGNTEKVVLGESDDYLNGLRNILGFDVKENVFIYQRSRAVLPVLLKQYQKLNRRLIVIGGREYKNVNDSILYDDEASLNYLFDHLCLSGLEMTIVIEDLFSLFARNESYSEKIYQLLCRNDLCLSILAFASLSQVSYKLLNSFDCSFIMDADDKQLLLDIYGINSHYQGNNFYFDKEPIPFVAIKGIETEEPNNRHSRLIPQIPEFINYRETDDTYLLGYDLLNRKEMYLPFDKRPVVIAYEEDELQNLRDLYHNRLDIQVYRGRNNAEIKDFIWYGEGLLQQRLFYCKYKKDLKEGEGLYVAGSKEYLLKLVNSDE